MLPIVSTEVISEVIGGVGNVEKVRTSWEAMIKNNPVLFDCITKVATEAAARKTIEGEMFLRGAMCVWETLRIQEEIDEMDREWGVE